MKHCIWCKQTEGVKTFNTKAHTIPQSLGGKFICDNVCDECNKTFGSYYFGLPPVELAIKEAFHITRARFLDIEGEVGKNKTMNRANTSQYFNIDLQKHTVKAKGGFKLRKGFLQNLGRQLRKGIFKIFLEETERVNGDGHDEKFDFIREFARYDIGDYPVLYFYRSFAIFTNKKLLTEPQLYFTEEYRSKYLFNGLGFCEFELLGHIFSIPTTRYYDLQLDEYVKQTKKIKKEFFSGFRTIDKFTDFDILLRSVFKD